LQKAIMWMLGVDEVHERRRVGCDASRSPVGANAAVVVAHSRPPSIMSTATKTPARSRAMVVI
jgi:hypothetical protein